jgi:hypothetical protein
MLWELRPSDGSVVIPHENRELKKRFAVVVGGTDGVQGDRNLVSGCKKEALAAAETASAMFPPTIVLL